VSAENSVFSRSDQGADQDDCLEMLSRLEGNDVEREDQLMLARLQRSINRRDRRSKSPETPKAAAEPVDRYERSVKKSLNSFKRGLTDHTAIENITASITTQYLKKYAGDDAEHAKM